MIWFLFEKGWITSNVGSVVEFSPATREARVRFPDVADFYLFIAWFYGHRYLFLYVDIFDTVFINLFVKFLAIAWKMIHLFHISFTSVAEVPARRWIMVIDKLFILYGYYG